MMVTKKVPLRLIPSSQQDHTQGEAFAGVAERTSETACVYIIWSHESLMFTVVFHRMSGSARMRAKAMLSLAVGLTRAPHPPFSSRSVRRYIPRK